MILMIKSRLQHKFQGEIMGVFSEIKSKIKTTKAKL